MKKPTTGLEARVERVCAEMLAFSMLLIFCSLGFSYHIGLQANSVEHQLFHSSTNLEGIKQNVAKMEAKRK